MTDTSTNERRPPLHLFEPAHRKATWWLAAIAGFAALLLAAPAISQAEEANPNNYNCLGSIAAGAPERVAFLKIVCGMSDADFGKYFLQAAFTGKSATPPKEVTSAASVKSFVASSPGAIGFVKA